MDEVTEGSGYASRSYAAALPHMGVPVFLERSHGWLLSQPIGESGYNDLRSAYPLFCCAEWQRLQDDIVALDQSFAAVSLVTDPFGDFTETTIRDCFPDIAFPFKTHYVADLSVPPRSFVANHHLRNVSKANKDLELFEAPRESGSVDAWCALYANLVKRHNIKGVQAFSRVSFQRQFDVPGLRVFVARKNDEIAGMLLCMTQGKYGYYHLAAYSELGYQLRASFGLMMFCFETLANDGIELISLGGAAGLLNTQSTDDGLARFKKGWSNSIRDVWFCGRIINEGAYSSICPNHRQSQRDFFPAYRSEYSAD